jgi:hypothetical protein
LGQTKNEHFEEHWTYPVNYPTEEGLKELKEIAKGHDQEASAQIPEIIQLADEHHYPTEEEAHQLHDVRVQLKADMEVEAKELEELQKIKDANDEHYVEHWTYPVSYPTEDMLEELEEIRKEHVEEVHANIAASVQKADENFASPVGYPTEKDLHRSNEIRAQLKVEKEAEKKKDAETRHHMWE